MTAERTIWCGLLAGMCLLGCGHSASTSTSTSLSLVVSGDTAGWITPCGCTANQSGGLERRASLLRSLGPNENVVYLDAGGSAAGKSEYQQIKLKSILLGDQLMGLELHNIGAPESQLSPDLLVRIGKEANTKWLSANIQPSQASDSIQTKILSHRVVVRQGVRILVTGVVDPDLVKNPLWKVRDASSSVLAILQKEKADITLVLAYMDEPGLRFLAESLPEVDFIIGGPTGQMLAPSQVGPVGIMSATNKGKFLARIELKKSGKVWKPVNRDAIEVSSTLPKDLMQSKNVDAYLAALADRDFPADESGLVTIQPTNPQQPGYQIAGSHACVQCHKQDDQTWHASKHSHAWQTLVDKRSHVDPSCQQCHTTGYGMAGGFVRVANSMPLVNVGCESCHGPSQSHVLDPKSKTAFLSREQCVRCHDHENSPEFNGAKYWEKIAHGR